MRLLPALLLLAGCGIGLSDYGDDTADTATAPVRIDGLEPDWGPTDGGTVVTLTGAGFEGAVTVTLGDTPAEVFVSDASTLLVTTPAASSEGAVDVRVETPLGGAVLPGAFTYSDTGDPGTGDGPVSGLVEFTLLQVACPTCFNTTQDLFVEASAAFHQPAQGSWIGWLPPMGSCAVNPQPAAPSSTLEDRGQWVYLESGSKSVALQRTTGEIGLIYQATGLGDEDYLRNASWDVVIPGQGADGVRIEGGVRTTEGFSDIQPIELLYTQPEMAFSAAIPRSGALFTWAPSGSGEKFVILVDGYDGTTGQFLGTVACVGPDSGSMGVPGAALSVFPAYSLVGVGLYRYQTNRVAVPGVDQTLEAVSHVGVLGTGTLVP